MRYNYGKLENNQIRYAPNILLIGKEQIINAPADTYKSQGWLPMVNTDMPEAEEGFYFSPIYIERDSKIVQQWEKIAIPETDEATETDYINALEDLGVRFDG